MKNAHILFVIFLVVVFVVFLNKTGKKMIDKDPSLRQELQAPTDTRRPWWQSQENAPDTQPSSDTSPQGTGNQQNQPQRGGASAANDSGPVGTMNHQYLQGANFKSMVVEIDYVQGMAPDSGAQNELLSQLRRYADKPSGISLSGGNSLSAQKNTYTVQDLYAAAQANRSTRSSGSTASLYILYVNGSLAGNPNALGAALNASFIVIFKDRIEAATTALVFSPEIERAVMVHELGHVFGLVNLTYKSSIAHEDAGHPGHSNSSGSVMYWAVEDISVANVLRGGPPYQFDSADQHDIQKIKAGEY